MATIIDETGAPVNLTGIANNAFSLTIYDTQTGKTRTGAGSFTVTNATSGVVQYAWAAGDVSVSGTFTLTITFTTANGPQDTDPVDWVVKPVGVH